MFPQQTNAEINFLKLEDRLKELNELIEEFELQLYLGKGEAISELEKQLKSFNGLINETKDKINSSDFINSAKAREISSKLEELQLNLVLDNAVTKNKLIEEVENFEKTIKSVEQLLESEAPGIGKNFNMISENFDKKTSVLKTIMEIVKLQYTLGKAELRDFIEENKDELTKRLSELKNNFNSKIELDSRTWKEFKNEISEIFRYLKDEIDNFK